MSERGPDLGLQDLSDRAEGALKAAWRKAREQRIAEDPTTYFPWHDLQSWMLEAPGLCENPVRVMLAVGGNRSGKSALAKGLLADILRRKSPINEQLVTTDAHTGEVRTKRPEDPLRIWVVPPTGEKFRQDWVSPSDGKGIRYWMGDRFVHQTRAPEHIFYGKVEGRDARDEMGNLRPENCDQILGKSQDQDMLTFEASEVDVAIFDEEPTRKEIVTSTLMRIATSNGALVFAFTPLHGMSWSWDRWWKPYIKQGRAQKLGDRRWLHAPEDKRLGATIAVQMGMKDNPRAQVFAEEVRRNPEMSEAEKAARLDGEYGYVEGALVPGLAGLDLAAPSNEHQLYVVDELPDPGDIATWYLVADPNKSYGALLSCIDHDGNLTVVTEHLRKNWPNRKHAKAFERMEKQYATSRVERYADPGAAGAQSIIDLEDFGMYFDTVRRDAGSVSRSIKRLRGLAWVDPNHPHPKTGERPAPRIYFFAPGLLHERIEHNRHGDDHRIITSQLVEQLSQARQKEGAAPDTPDKSSQKLDLFDCLRYTADLAGAHRAAPMPKYGPDKTEDQSDRLPRESDLQDAREALHYSTSLHETPIALPRYRFDQS